MSGGEEGAVNLTGHNIIPLSCTSLPTNPELLATINSLTHLGYRDYTNDQ